MAEYKVLSAKRWGGAIQAQPDPDGYFMHSITVEGHTSEPIDYKSRDFPAVGSTVSGELVEYVSQAGNHRTRLETAETKKVQTATQDRIAAQWALGQALAYSQDHQDLDTVTEYAKALISKVDEIVSKEE